MPSDATPQVSTASSWKGAAVEGQVITLPSGNVVRCKRTMDLMTLMKAGKIPNPLSGIINSMVSRGGQMPSMDDVGDEGVSALLGFIDKNVIESVVEPKIVPVPEPEKDEDADAYADRLKGWTPDDPDAVPISWIDMDDRMFIFTFSQGMASDLESFREEQAAAMASVADGPGASRAAKRASGRR